MNSDARLLRITLVHTLFAMGAENPSSSFIRLETKTRTKNIAPILSVSFSKMQTLRLFLVVSLILLTHCATARSIHAWQSGDIFILSGTSLNSRIIEEKDCARFSERFFAVLDFPFSALGDVLLLAATVPLQLIDFLTRIGALLRHEKPYPFFERERYQLATEQGENEFLCKVKYAPAF